MLEEVWVGVGDAGAGVGVLVAGGVTCRSSRCSGRRTEEPLNPFQAMRSATVISYNAAIQERFSPGWTMW